MRPPASGGKVPLVGVTFAEGYPETMFRLQARLETPTLSGEPEPVPATLVRDPDNEFDPNAISVVVHDMGHVGHFPRELAARYAPDIDGGAEWTAAVVSVRIVASDPSHPGITVQCWRRAA